MKFADKIKTAALSALSNNKLKSLALSALPGMVATFLAAQGFDWTSQQATLYGAAVIGWTWGALEAWLGKTNAKGVVVTQLVLKQNHPEVKPDGYAGPVTQGAVAVEANKS